MAARLVKSQMRAATERDRNQGAAASTFSEGERLRGRGDAESLRDAIKKYEEALSLYRATGDHNGEASVLSRLGETYRLHTRMIEEGQPLARLPYSRKEAMAIASLVPKGQRKIALGFDVNYQNGEG